MIQAGSDSVYSFNWPSEHRPDLLPRSPISDIRGERRPAPSQGEIQRALREGVLLGDASHLGVLLIRGEGAQAMIEDSLGQAPSEVGDLIVQGDVLVGRRRVDEFELLCPSFEAVQGLAGRLDPTAVDGVITMLDIGHGRAGIFIAGAKSRALLSRVSSLDFSHSQFPDRHLVQAEVSEIRASIIRRDRPGAPAYYLGVDRSLAAYLWRRMRREIDALDGAVVDGARTPGILSAWPVE
jgi:sarcosine oxidase gamma subunit